MRPFRLSRDEILCEGQGKIMPTLNRGYRD
jgi:hypothetical protein